MLPSRKETNLEMSETSSHWSWRVGACALLATSLSIVPASLSANERHFSFSQESSTLAAGTAELEPQVTWRGGRERYYSAFDNRLEFEFGITDSLQAAFYLNSRAIGQGVEGVDERVSSFAYKGVSGEFKLNLMDSVADALGLALYFEATVQPAELEFEEKIIIDKNLGNFLLVSNIVFEQEFGLDTSDTETEHKIAIDLGASYEVADKVWLGLELFTKSEIKEEEGYEGTVFFAGPTLAYTPGGYWLTLSVAPQVFALRAEGEEGEGAEGDSDEDEGFRDLRDNEAIHVRAILGFDL